MVPWPDFVPGANGEIYKEFSSLLPNRRGLKKADCSFWSKYIRSLKAPAGREARSRRGPGGGWGRSCSTRIAVALLPGLESLGRRDAFDTAPAPRGRQSAAPLRQGAPVLMGPEGEVTQREAQEEGAGRTGVVRDCGVLGGEPASRAGGKREGRTSSSLPLEGWVYVLGSEF